jgi:hypothetical protein
MKSSDMLPNLRRALLQACASLALLGAVPPAAAATPLPPAGLTASLAVVVPPGESSPAVVHRNGKAGLRRIGTFRERLGVWRAWRSFIRASADDGKADRLAKRSLTFGIISMSALLMAWVPVVGALLLLGAVPMGVLAIVDGLKARRLGSEKSAGLVLGIVSVSLFVLLMILALLVLVGVLVFLGG